MPEILLPIGAAMVDEIASEEEALNKQKEDQIKQRILDEEALKWKTDQDIIDSYSRFLGGDLVRKSGYKIYFSVEDFLMRLLGQETCFGVAHILKKGQLFKKTLDENPDKINEFISATSCRSSPHGLGNLLVERRLYVVEKDIFENRKQLFISVLPSCPCINKGRTDHMISSYEQDRLIKTLGKTYIKHINKSALSEDPIVPAVIMTHGDMVFLKKYREFLMKKDGNYSPDSHQIDKTFALAASGAYWHKEQISPCRYVRVTPKQGFFGTTYYQTTVAPIGSHACPVASQSLLKFRKLKKFVSELLQNVNSC